MKLGFLLYNDIQLMDFIAPLEIAAFWQKLDNGIELINIAETTNDIIATNGVTLTPDYNYTTCPELDYLCVPGGIGRSREVNNPNTLNFIKKQEKCCSLVMSVCTGAFLLAESGILYKATTYWRALKEFKETYPDIIIEESRIVKDAKVWTSGGVSSGIDLMFELIKTVAGESVASQVQLLTEYFPESIFTLTKKDISDLPAYYTKEKSCFENKTLPQYIENNYAKFY